MRLPKGHRTPISHIIEHTIDRHAHIIPLLRIELWRQRGFLSHSLFVVFPFVCRFTAAAAAVVELAATRLICVTIQNAWALIGRLLTFKMARGLQKMSVSWQTKMAGRSIVVLLLQPFKIPCDDNNKINRFSSNELQMWFQQHNRCACIFNFGNFDERMHSG